MVKRIVLINSILRKVTQRDTEVTQRNTEEEGTMAQRRNGAMAMKKSISLDLLNPFALHIFASLVQDQLVEFA